MKKTLLVGLGVFAFTTASFASDITNPFYLPDQGEIGSVTSVVFDKNKAKNVDANYRAKSYDKQVQENIQYGLTKSVAFMGTVGSVFGKTKSRFGKAKGDVDEDTPYFSAGFGWNILSGPARLQLQAVYGQSRGGYKYVSSELKTGYQFKTFLPYVSIGEELPINQPAGMNKPVYNAKVGVYQRACEKWGLDTGIRWGHSEDGEQTGIFAELEASYYLTAKSALSLVGNYLIDGWGKYGTQLYDESIGLKLRYFF